MNPDNYFHFNLSFFSAWDFKEVSYRNSDSKHYFLDSHTFLQKYFAPQRFCAVIVMIMIKTLCCLSLSSPSPSPSQLSQFTESVIFNSLQTISEIYDRARFQHLVNWELHVVLSLYESLWPSVFLLKPLFPETQTVGNWYLPKSSHSGSGVLLLLSIPPSEGID